jgi:hypothetical protein
MSNIKWLRVNPTILKGRDWGIERRDGTNARHSMTNIESFSFMSGIQDTQWHGVSSKGFGHPCPCGLAGCNPYGILLGWLCSLSAAFSSRCSMILAFLESPLHLWLHCHRCIHCSLRHLLIGTWILPHIAWSCRPSFEIWVEASMKS